MSDDKNTAGQRSRPDNVKLFEGLLAHASRVALVQYGLSGTFAYLLFTDALHHPSPIDLFGHKFELTLWITAAPLVYTFINFHMWRVIRQMMRLLRRDRKNAASMAIMAVQSAWFGNPLHNAVSKGLLSIGGLFYMTMIGMIPFFYSMNVADNIFRKAEHSILDTISFVICNFIFVGSIFMLLFGALELCGSQIRKVLLRPPLWTI
jgi:hypothetical protein